MKKITELVYSGGPFLRIWNGKLEDGSFISICFKRGVLRVGEGATPDDAVRDCRLGGIIEKAFNPEDVDPRGIKNPELTKELREIYKFPAVSFKDGSVDYHNPVERRQAPEEPEPAT